MAIFWQERLGRGANVDGRFWVNASKPVYAYVVVSSDNAIEAVYQATLKDAPGDIRKPGLPAKVTLDTDFDPRTTNDRRTVDTLTLGRAADVYEFDSAVATLNVQAPPEGNTIAYFLTMDAGPKSAWRVFLGEGAIPDQTFAAKMAYADSAQRSMGMYGTLYDLTVNIANTETCSARGPARHVAVRLGSFGCGTTRCYDGWAAMIARQGDSDQAVYHHVVTTAESRVHELGRFRIDPCYKKVVRIMMMMPGLSSIPQSLFFETVPESAPAPTTDACGG
jgi:hypothetical protein